MNERFRGSLSNYRLSLLVPALFENGKSTSGTLALERGATRRTFLIERGQVVAATSNEPGEHLAEVLANLGLLDRATSALAFEAASRAGKPLGAYLLAEGLLDAARLREALEHKAREAFFDCYCWESGECEFMPTAPKVPGGGELSLPLSMLHRDALARLGEWNEFRETFPRLDLQAQVFPGSDHSAEERALLAALDAGFTIFETISAAPGGRLEAARRMLSLFRRGTIEIPDDRVPRFGELTDLVELARQSIAEGNYEHAARLAQQALMEAPVPEAQAVYRVAERHLGAKIESQVSGLEGRLEFEALPPALPERITSDDLYLYTKLRSARSIAECLRAAAMGQLAAYRALQRLLQAGLVRLREPSRRSLAAV